MEMTTSECWHKWNQALTIAINNVKTYPEDTNMIYQLVNIFRSFAKPGMLKMEDVEEMERMINRQIGKTW